jgi:hypothetical protein
VPDILQAARSGPSGNELKGFLCRLTGDWSLHLPSLADGSRAQLGITLGQAALTAADVNRLTDAETDTVEFDPAFSDA